ncbi:MAG: DUF4105 domain-containing protein [Bacteroidota bacterium]
MKPFFVCLLLFRTIYGFAYDISEHAEISLLTADPGTELYSVFGHSAVRVNDTVNGIDWVYNYGTFDFNTSHFYIKFARGKLQYMLTRDRFRHFLPEYIYSDRSVYEQVLNLAYEEKKRMVEFLEWNLLPENRFYKYDFFYDNCATRIRDLVTDNINPVIYFDTTKMIKKRSFRDLIDFYLKNMKWNKFGIDLALGLPADKIAEPREYMFLPDWMKEAFSGAQIEDGRRLIKKSQVIFKGSEQSVPPTIITPKLVLWLLFLIGILSLMNKRFSLIYDKTLFFASGLTGIIIFLLWFATDHSTTHYNYNLLWAIPVHFVAAFYIGKENKYWGVRLYFMITFVIAFFTLILWGTIPQNLNEALIPLVLILFIKSAKISGADQWLRKLLMQRGQVW